MKKNNINKRKRQKIKCGERGIRMEKAKHNAEYIIFSYQNQLAEANMKIAERDSKITELFQENEQMKKDLQEREKEIAELKRKVEELEKKGE